jgi:SprT protein
MKTTADFTRLVNLCLDAARERFGDFPRVEIRYDLRGQAAGMACCKRSRLTGEASDFVLRFNVEAMQKDWAHMVCETIPHEVAHIVGYALPHLGARNHNAQWRRVSQSLGAKGDRCHTIQLTPAKKRTRYLYVLDTGHRVVAGPKHHKMIQQHGRLAGLRCRETRVLLDRHHFQEAIAA